MKTINTVLGPLETSKMGFTLMHEHLMCAGQIGISQFYPELLGKDYKERIIKALIAAKKSGVNTLVDATTLDIGRDIKVSAEVSQKSGVNIIACAGWYLEMSHFLGSFTSDQFAKVFAREIKEGVEGTNIKAGILKSAADIEGVTKTGEILLRGVARAQLMTGVPMLLHSYSPGQVGRHQIAILKEEGVELRHVKMDHSLDTTDLEYLTWMMDQGCYLGVDRLPATVISPSAVTSISARIKTIKALIDAGYSDRLLLSHDTILVCTMYDTMPDAVRAQLAKNNPYGLLFIPDVLIPELRKMGVSETNIKKLNWDNPRRFFEGN